MEISFVSSDYHSEGFDPMWEKTLNDCRTQEEVLVLLQKKMDSDEWIVRKELVKAWTKILDKYARPGVHIPSVEEVRRELLEVGVDGAVKKVVDAHWCVWSFMIRDKIEKKVGRGLDMFDLEGFVSDVRMAQNDPGMKNALREMIERYVLHEEF